MKLQFDTVADAIKCWNILFPYRRDNEELPFLAAKFFKALSPLYSDEAFALAADIIEIEETAFPTIAHMRKIVNVVADKIVRDRERNNDLLAIPEETELSPEEEAENLEKINIINKMLAGKLSITEAVKAQEKIKHYVAK